MLAQICLRRGAVDLRTFARLASEHDLGFVPRRISSRGHEVPYSSEGLERLAASGEAGPARIEGDGRAMLTLGGIAGRPVDQLIWDADAIAADASLIEAATRLPGFTAAYLSDGDDVYWQSETSLEAYELRGRSHAGLPKVAGGFFPGEEEEIDVSGNPGRAVPVDGLWLLAASTMWFGSNAFEILDRARLLGTPVGEATSLPGDVVRVALFPPQWYESNLEAVRSRQREFRDWMDFDGLEARAAEIEAE